jgi:hypothetical protein
MIKNSPRKTSFRYTMVSILINSLKDNLLHCSHSERVIKGCISGEKELSAAENQHQKI